MEKEKLLLNIDYSDNTGKFWRDSYIKNKVIPKEAGETIHEAIKKAIAEIDGLELSYNGKPQSNVFVDTKDGEAKAIGYIYRAKDEINGKKALFDVWATVKKVEDYTIETLE